MKVPVNEPLLNGNEKTYLNECIESGWISSEGPFVEKFETKLATTFNRKYGIAVANGSVAIDVAITALGIGKDDEVIMPTFTIISCISQLIRVGAKPILVDVDLETWNMRVEDIRGKITEKTKAIMAVHIYGLPVDMDPILDLAKEFNLYVIEDAAEVIGQNYKGKPCGSFGDISTVSFYPNKHITTGEGGMIFTNNERLNVKCRELRNLSFIPPRRFIHEELGWNFRLTNLQAAIGLAQFERIDEFVAKKKLIGKWYTELLSDLTQVKIPLQKTDYAENIYWIYGLVIERNIGLNAVQIMEKLADFGVATRPFFYPMHKQPVLKKLNYFIDDYHPNSEILSEFGFYIPSGLALTREQAEYVSNILHKIFK